ncbi:MAG: hypothetical protein IJX10_00980 [Phascolarctobacterium sp.]|nr:hypothetical protein [Phascolarctobacterium sp.]
MAYISGYTKENFIDTLHNAYRLLSDLKEKYDVADFIKGLFDIWNLLFQKGDNNHSMYLKFRELDYKYGAYANFLSCGHYAVAVCCYNITYREFLIFYLRNLPKIVFLKLGVSRVASRSGEQLFFGYIK